MSEFYSDSYKDEEMREMEQYYCWKCKNKRNDNCWCDGKHDGNHDGKHDHKHCHKNGKRDGGRDFANLVDFEFYTLTPNVSEDNRFELPVGMQTAVASVTLDRVRQGDLVWLNGVFGLDNDGDEFATVTMRIFKGNPPINMSGQEIYRAIIEIDNEGNDDQVVEPLAHVDVITQGSRNETYTVTLESDEPDVFLNGPVTFTAALIEKD